MDSAGRNPFSTTYTLNAHLKGQAAIPALTLWQGHKRMSIKRCNGASLYIQQLVNSIPTHAYNMSRYGCKRCWTHRAELFDHPPPGKEALSESEEIKKDDI